MARLSETQWGDACKMWASGNHTLKEISNQFGISSTSLVNGFQKRGVEKGSSAEALRKAELEAQKKAITQHCEDVIKETLETRLTNVRAVSAIGKKVISIISRANSENKSMATIGEEIKVLSDAIKVFDVSTKVINVLAPIPTFEIDEGQTPLIRVERLTDGDIVRIRERQRIEEEEILGISSGDMAEESPSE